MGKKKHAASTPATAALDAAGISYTAHHYVHSDSAESYGGEAAQQLGVDGARVFKTLMVSTGASPAQDLAIAVVPVDSMLDLKAAGLALGKKKAQMADKDAAQRRSGYVLGGISPFGQRQHSATVIDSSAEQFETIFISGGRRGFSLELSWQDAVKATGAILAKIATH
ncbi:Cys-tRNA(Pro)/Cys-tRNA(Cys) deacylase [Glutamicibacter uratoxydans]|uniref:Cys-tRNA(Pro)/Cys-tRNA(Cys) deacylase n=1 Tax=Glutamicibacter uratoxydans TaxID=43667 RepID=A0A4Y4DS60_GLUUR|nr:Cys-tRNA(Pro) deacylase [Glutamicibacter uratoxydans]GED07493.1 Cys-tRNA(Pro)/Cys-tRNA(Cys) deacylase [Glutamicibacter uratoxydans]